MLSQHAGELGRKTVARVTLFYGEGEVQWNVENPSLVFWITGVDDNGGL